MFTFIKESSFAKSARVSFLPVLLIMIALFTLSACGSDPTATPAAPTATVAGANSTTDTNSTTDSAPASTSDGIAIQATLREWAIDLSSASVSAGTVTFTVTNTGSMAHNFTVKDASGNVVGATTTFAPSAGAQTLSVKLSAGTYTILCSLPGHAQKGQQTTLTVK